MGDPVTELIVGESVAWLCIGLPVTGDLNGALVAAHVVGGPVEGS